MQQHAPLSPSGSFVMPRLLDSAAPLEHRYKSDGEVLAALAANKLMCSAVVLGLAKDAQRPFADAAVEALALATEPESDDAPPPSHPPDGGWNSNSSSAPGGAGRLGHEAAADLLGALVAVEFKRTAGRGEPHAFMRSNGLVPTLLDALCVRTAVGPLLQESIEHLVAALVGDEQRQVAPIVEGAATGAGEGCGAASVEEQRTPSGAPSPPPLLPCCEALDQLAQQGGDSTPGPELEGAEALSAVAKETLLAALDWLIAALAESAPRWPPLLRRALGKVARLAERREMRQRSGPGSPAGPAGCEAPPLSPWSPSSPPRSQRSAGVPMRSSMLSTIIVLRVLCPAVLKAFSQREHPEGPFSAVAMKLRRRVTFFVKAVQKVASGRAFDAPHEAHLHFVCDALPQRTITLHAALDALRLDDPSSAVGSPTRALRCPVPAPTVQRSTWRTVNSDAPPASPTPLHAQGSVRCSLLILSSAPAIIGQLAHLRPIFIGTHEIDLRDLVGVCVARHHFFSSSAVGAPAASSSSPAPHVVEQPTDADSPSVQRKPQRGRIRSLLSRLGSQPQEATAARRKKLFKELVTHGYYAEAHPHVMQQAHRFLAVAGRNAVGAAVVVLYGSLLAESLAEFTQRGVTNRMVLEKLLPSYESSFDDADIVAHICARLDALLLSHVEFSAASPHTLSFIVAFMEPPEGVRCPLGPQWLRRVLATYVDERIARACTAIVSYRPSAAAAADGSSTGASPSTGAESGSGTRSSKPSPDGGSASGFFGRLFRKNSIASDDAAGAAAEGGSGARGDGNDSGSGSGGGGGGNAAAIVRVTTIRGLCAALQLPLRESSGVSVQILGLPVPDQLAWEREAFEDAAVDDDGERLLLAPTPAAGEETPARLPPAPSSVPTPSPPRPTSILPGLPRSESSPRELSRYECHGDVQQQGGFAGARGAGQSLDSSTTAATATTTDADAGASFDGGYVVIDTWRDVLHAAHASSARGGNPEQQGVEVLWPLDVLVDVLGYVSVHVQSQTITNRTRYSTARDLFATLRDFREVQLPQCLQICESAQRLRSSHGSHRGYVAQHSAQIKALVEAEVSRLLARPAMAGAASGECAPHLGLQHVPLKALWRVLLLQLAANCRQSNATQSIVAAAVEEAVQGSSAVDDASLPALVIRVLLEEVGESAASMVSLVCAVFSFATHLICHECFLPSEATPERTAAAREQLTAAMSRFFACDASLLPPPSSGRACAEVATYPRRGGDARSPSVEGTTLESNTPPAGENDASSGLGGADMDVEEGEDEAVLGRTTTGETPTLAGTASSVAAHAVLQSPTFGVAAAHATRVGEPRTCPLDASIKTLARCIIINDEKSGRPVDPLSMMSKFLGFVTDLASEGSTHVQGHEQT